MHTNTGMKNIIFPLRRWKIGNKKGKKCDHKLVKLEEAGKSIVSVGINYP